MSAAPDAVPAHRCLSRRSAIGGVACAGLAVPFLAACSSDSDSSEGSDSGQVAAGGTAVAPTSEIPVGGGVIFADDGVVITQPTEGDFKAFGAECTHQGCTVTEVTETIDCACHGSSFSLEDGAPTAGPATDPLPTVEISVENGEITLA